MCSLLFPNQDFTLTINLGNFKSCYSKFLSHFTLKSEEEKKILVYSFQTFFVAKNSMNFFYTINMVYVTDIIPFSDYVVEQK